MKRHYLSLLVVCCFLTSCRIHFDSAPRSNYGKGLVLASKEGEDGRTFSWRLYYNSKGAGSRIDLTETFVQTTPEVGITVGAVNRERAQTIGVTPFEGVWVTVVNPNSAAASVGLSVGDIIMSVNGVKMSSPEQYQDYFKQNAAVDEPMLFTIRVYRTQGEPLDGERRASVEVVPIGRDVRETNTHSIALEGSAGILKYTGLRVAELSSELCEELYGVSESRVVVSSVGQGSPAYYSGLREGDWVQTCDGEAVQSLDDLRVAVLRRVQMEKLSGALYDLATFSPIELGEESYSKVVLEVQGPIGRHTAKLEVADDLSDETDFTIPILFDYESDIERAKVSFLDFIFQFGFNYRSRTRHSKTREPVETWELSMLPLGMFEIERGVTRNRYTVFWLIDFETR